MVDLLHIRALPTHAVRRLARRPEALVLVVPGNPGVPRLYVPFIDHLYRLGDGRLSVAMVGHAGHAPGHPPPPGQGCFGLDDQLAHQRAFLRTLPPAPVVHLVGHSIGAWLVLQLLDTLPPAQRGQAVMLFPTIERMALTPNGRLLRPLFSSLRPAGVALVRAARRLPGRQRLLTGLLLSAAPPAERAVLLAGLEDIDPAGIDNVLGMADEELRRVTTLPEQALRRHAARLTMYYGQADRWNLPDMADTLAQRVPRARVIRAGHRHAFVLSDSAAVAAAVHGCYAPEVV